MRIHSCAPLGGQGLVVRQGDLVALTDGLDAGPDPVIGALAAVAEASGDGSALVLAITRAALERGGRPAWACAGVTFGGELVVLVHGDAVAAVAVDGGPEAEVTAVGSMIPVVRTFSGDAVIARLGIGGLAVPDPRLRLDGGVVYGGGLVLAASPEGTPAGATVGPEAHAGVGTGAPSMPGPVRQEPAPPESALPQPAVPYEPTPYEPTVLSSVPVRSDGPPRTDAPPQPAPTTLQLDQDPEAEFPGAEHPAADPPPESWFRADPVDPGRAPTAHQQALSNAVGPTQMMSQGDLPGSAAGAEPAIAAVEMVELAPAEPVLVDGVMCARMHFNAPNAQFCRECGMSMLHVTRDVRRNPRPPLGVLLIDDGRGYLLDRDYVIGREPVLDGDVAAGRATPLKLTDPAGTVSRLHLRVSLSGWQVEVRDLGSANGSRLYIHDGTHELAPHDDAVIEPGAQVGVGRRTIGFLPYRSG